MNHILLLHGALGAKEQLLPLKALLEKNFTVHLLNFSGHGGLPFTGNFSIPLFAGEVALYLKQNNIAATHIFGYSMGGYVAMYLASTMPQKVKSIVTLATKFKWDNDIASKEVKMLNAEKIQEKLPAFALQLQQRHAPNNWKDILHKTSNMLLDMGKDNPLQMEDYKNILTPALLLIGSNDNMVSLDETLAVSQNLPNGRMEVLPNTSHPIEQADVNLLYHQIKQFTNTSTVF